MKESLKEKSTVARRLNDLINPMFNRIRDSIVTEEEIRESKCFAREATHPTAVSVTEHCQPVQELNPRAESHR
jgi:hypothetical protein